MSAGTAKRQPLHRSRYPLCMLLAGLPAAAGAEEVLAQPPSDLSVTVYRAPGRDSGSMNLDSLWGYALITERRVVRLPAGTSRLAFEGVADGIEPASAIVTGLNGVVEKNRDAAILSPGSLLAAVIGKPVTLERTNRATGRQQRVPGTIRSDAGGGVVFETAEGIEALRCSGLPETFSFEGVAGLHATPTLSVQVQTPAALTRTVTLSYLARGFDWSADYTAILSPDATSMDLGAWVTLANGNGVGFPGAQTQVVAGRVDHAAQEETPESALPISAQCWPQGSSSDSPPVFRTRDGRQVFEPLMFKKSDALMAVAVTASANRVQQEQLGDLKLYRIPERTTVASRQSKQVRLLDRSSIPVKLVYSAELSANQPGAQSASRLLRSRNTSANHLGLALPSGSVTVFSERGATRVLEHASSLRDLAVEEELELDLGESSEVRVSAKAEEGRGAALPAAAGALPRASKLDAVNRVEVSNARDREIQFELRLRLPDGARVVRTDHALGTKDGRPIFRFSVPANDAVTLRYQTQRGRV